MHDNWSPGDILLAMALVFTVWVVIVSLANPGTIVPY